jgi:prepilin peptidase CpaA
MTQEAMQIQNWFALGAGLAATVEDLWRRNISNWIPIVALVGGLLAHSLSDGWWGLARSLGGAVLGFLVFLIFYVLGGMGGGDVKLMAGFGAILGVNKLLAGALWTAGLGGVMAALVIATQEIIRLVRGKKQTAEEKAQKLFIPYAPAITLGCWLGLIT